MEASQVLLEVHVKPLTTGPPCFGDGGGNEPTPDPCATRVRRNDRVEKDRVDAAVPGDFDEAQEASTGPSANHPRLCR
jgi:hypothetical protein